MYQQITSLINQIKHHQHQHKVTIFNKQKNNENTHSHNITEGKLVEVLKKFEYFQQLNRNLGVEFLLKAIKFIEPYFLRKNKLLVSVKERNAQGEEYLLCEGVLAIYQIKEEEEGEVEDGGRKKKTLAFQRYISNGSHLSLSEYRENEYQIVSQTDCQMLKLPSKLDLDPIKHAKQINQLTQQFSRNPDFYKCKAAVSRSVQDIKRIKKHEIDPTYGLSHFDFDELLMKAKIQTVESHTKIYQTEETVTRIGLVLNGKVVEENVKERSKKVVTYDNAILTFYKKNYSEAPNKVEKSETLLQEADWIGLEDYIKLLEDKPFRLQKIARKSDEQKQQILVLEQNEKLPRQLGFSSSKEIRAKENCQILWIPVLYFARKFNYQTNFTTVDQWMAIYDIKNEAKAKSTKIQEKIQTQKKERQAKTFLDNGDQLPRLPGKLQELSHNISNLSTKTEQKSKLIYEKQLKFGKLWLRNVTISDTSLLGITMKKESELQFSQISEQGPELKQFKKFSHFSRSTRSKLLEIASKPKQTLETIKSRKSMSEHKIEPKSFYGVDSSPEDLIMYPQAYEPNKLSPELKKQLFQAQKALRLQQIQYKLPTKSSLMALQHSRTQSIEHDPSRQNRLSSINSKASLNYSTIPSNSPQMLYKNLAEKISFKFPSLQERLKAQKIYKARNKKFENATIKDRIQTLKILEEAEKKKMVRIRHNLRENNKKEHNDKSRQMVRWQHTTHRASLSQRKLQLYS